MNLSVITDQKTCMKVQFHSFIVHVLWFRGVNYGINRQTQLIEIISGFRVSLSWYTGTFDCPRDILNANNNICACVKSLMYKKLDEILKVFKIKV